MAVGIPATSLVVFESGANARAEIERSAMNVRTVVAVAALSFALVEARPVAAAPVPASPAQGAVGQATANPRDPVANFEYAWNRLDRNYAQFGAKRVDWDALRRVYRAKVTARHDRRGVVERPAGDGAQPQRRARVPAGRPAARVRRPVRWDEAPGVLARPGEIQVPARQGDRGAQGEGDLRLADARGRLPPHLRLQGQPRPDLPGGRCRGRAVRERARARRGRAREHGGHRTNGGGGGRAIRRHEAALHARPHALRPEARRPAARLPERRAVRPIAVHQAHGAAHRPIHGECRRRVHTGDACAAARHRRGGSHRGGLVGPVPRPHAQRLDVVGGVPRDDRPQRRQLGRRRHPARPAHRQHLGRRRGGHRPADRVLAGPARQGRAGAPGRIEQPREPQDARWS